MIQKNVRNVRSKSWYQTEVIQVVSLLGGGAGVPSIDGRRYSVNGFSCDGRGKERGLSTGD